MFLVNPVNLDSIKYIVDVLGGSPEISALLTTLRTRSLGYLARTLTDEELYYLYYGNIDERSLGEFNFILNIKEIVFVNLSKIFYQKHQVSWLVSKGESEDIKFWKDKFCLDKFIWW